MEDVSAVFSTELLVSLSTSCGPKNERSGFLLALALSLSSCDMCSILVLVTISTLLAAKTLQSIPLTTSVLSPPHLARRDSLSECTQNSGL